jgi:hypothetical protein
MIGSLNILSRRTESKKIHQISAVLQASATFVNPSALRRLRRTQMNNSWKNHPGFTKISPRLSYRDGLAPDSQRSCTRDRRIITDAKRNRLAPASDVASLTP